MLTTYTCAIPIHTVAKATENVEHDDENEARKLQFVEGIDEFDLRSCSAQNATRRWLNR